MKQATLQKYFTSGKKSQVKCEEENKSSQEVKNNQESKIQEIQFLKPASSEKEQKSSPKRLNRLKKNESDGSDHEMKLEKEESLNFDNFGFLQSQESCEKKSLAVFKKDVKAEKKTQAKKQKTEQKIEVEQENEENQIPNTDFKHPTDKLNVYEEFDDVTPKWASIGFSRDKQGRLHNTSDADPTTLQIPQNEFNKLTKCMQQFWRYKSENFDKIIFFKLGKFYELFYDDAYIGNKYLDLNWMGKKMHTGFPEKAVHKYKALLLEYGYKVVIVDQTETPDQMQQRVTQNKKSGVGNTDKIVQRSISEILTKGTYLYSEGEQQTNLEEKTLLVIRKYIVSSNQENYGIAMFERQTNTISLAFIENCDKNYEKLKTLLLHMKPVETVIDQNNIMQYDPVLKMIKGNVIQSIISFLSYHNDNWDHRKGLHRIQQHYPNNLPEAIKYYQDNQLVMQTLNGLFSYLNQILIMDKVLGCARFKLYDEQFSLQQCLILDSQALFHLEILQSVGTTSKKDFSLFGIINATTTPGGHRLLRKWLCSPLYQIDQITERQKQVQDLSKFQKERDILRQSVKNYPDLERMCSRIYEYAVKIDSKAIFYENLSQTRLKEFKSLVSHLQLLLIQVQKFGKLKEYFTSSRLKSLVTLTTDGGLVPDISTDLEEFQNCIVWDEKERPKPAEGVFESYDQSLEEVRAQEKELQEYLQQIRRQFKNDQNINFCHAKFRYEIEVPNDLVEKKKPDDFEFTSSRTGFKRYLTQTVKDLVAKLEKAEEFQNKQLTSFGNFIFQQFQNNYIIWDQLINILNELDALCSLSVFGDTFDSNMTWPTFISNEIKLVIKNGKHPCLLNINYVANSIDMGGKLTKFQLLSGPNMGGKSTTLRMVCVLTILAQLGCKVPCDEMTLSPVDRIFTRIGAKDFLMEGKSTFYVELEETLIPLKYGTQNSLFITDELGRGTSTYDGVAIASAVMKYLINKIGCRVLFATHFRILIEEAKLMKEVTNVHMGSSIIEGKVVFLYVLKEGACEASFGINVAKVVGIDSRIISKAQEMADFFENKASLKNSQLTLQQFNKILGDCELLKI